jgi:hypothetical protein
MLIKIIDLLIATNTKSQVTIKHSNMAITCCIFKECGGRPLSPSPSLSLSLYLSFSLSLYPFHSLSLSHNTYYHWDLFHSKKEKDPFTDPEKKKNNNSFLYMS